jgi:hypothetical protein
LLWLFPFPSLFPVPFLFPYRERILKICWVIHRSICPHNSVDGLVCDRIALKVRQENVVEFVDVLLDR